MTQKSFRQALNDALHYEMARDPRVIMLGEDLTGGAGASGAKDAWGGAFGVTRGLLGTFGPERIRDTPISETAFIGAAAGAALTGLRPIAEIMFVDFVGVCLDQIMNQVAKFRYMFGGRAKTPLVIRATYGACSRSGIGPKSSASFCPRIAFPHRRGQNDGSTDCKASFNNDRRIGPCSPQWPGCRC